jgi:hypothetical protein
MVFLSRRVSRAVGTGEERRDDSRRGAEAQRMTENEIGTRVNVLIEMFQK